MKQVPNDFQIIIEDGKPDIDVEVNYRCFFEPNKCMAPMCVSGSIYSGHSLQDFVKHGKQSYEQERDSEGNPKWLKVDVMSIHISE